MQHVKEKKESPAPNVPSHPKNTKFPQKNNYDPCPSEMERKSDSSSLLNRPRRKRGEGQIRIMFTGFNPTQRSKEVSCKWIGVRSFD